MLSAGMAVAMISGRWSMRHRSIKGFYSIGLNIRGAFPAHGTGRTSQQAQYEATTSRFDTTNAWYLCKVGWAGKSKPSRQFMASWQPIQDVQEILKDVHGTYIKMMSVRPKLQSPVEQEIVVASIFIVAV